MKHLAFCILISFIGVAFCEETYLLEDWSFTKDGRTEIVRIPHDWAISGPFNRTNDSQFVQVWNDGETQPHTREGRTGGLPVVGTGIYEKTIKIPENTGWASLVFDGIMDQSRIFVDNKLIAERKNGYAIFEAPFSPEPGERKIRVEVTVEPMGFTDIAVKVTPKNIVNNTSARIRFRGNAKKVQNCSILPFTI